MGWWDAFSHAMRTCRTGRIGLTEADRLVNGEPVAPAHIGLSTLLSAATAPPFAQELADERAAVTGFTRAHPGADATTTRAGRRRAWIPLSTRAIAVKVAAGVAVLVTGGTAFAATTGHLPTGLQQHAHDLFSPLGVPVPAPGTGTGSGSATPGGAATSGPPRQTPTAGASSRAAAPTPGNPEALGLCQAWEATQKNPHGKAMTPQLRRALATAAGSEARIPGFCTDLLADPHAGASTGTTPTPQPGAPAASHPNGNSTGGDSTGDGKTRGHPTAGPHPSR
jgi:hypothetical protein